MTRKKYTIDFKQQVIQEALETGNNAVVARRYDLNPNMVGRWVREHKKDKLTKTSDAELVQDYNQIAKENEQLKKLLGEKDLEIAILKDLIKKKNPHLLTKLK
ncbi:transposase [Desulfotomaculum varum]